MKQLLDTHSFIWFVTGNSRITSKVRSQIENNENLLSSDLPQIDRLQLIPLSQTSLCLFD